jgi:hypothetical protein
MIFLHCSGFGPQVAHVGIGGVEMPLGERNSRFSIGGTFAMTVLREEPSRASGYPGTDGSDERAGGLAPARCGRIVGPPASLPGRGQQVLCDVTQRNRRCPTTYVR